MIDEQAEEDQVSEAYRKMSLEHSKKVGKDIIEAINKDGKNNSKFYEISLELLNDIFDMFFLMSDADYTKFPYALIEALCVNTINLDRIIASLVSLLYPLPEENSIINNSLRKASLQNSDGNFSSMALKVLHVISHLTRIYSIAMAFFRVNPLLLDLVKLSTNEDQS